MSYAILAPHSHNLQSWLVDLRQPDEITLYCDLGRLLPETDPYSRQIMMSHGTFLELLDLAAREKGLRAQIELFPEGEFDSTKIDQRPVARIRLATDNNHPLSSPPQAGSMRRTQRLNSPLPGTNRAYSPAEDGGRKPARKSRKIRMPSWQRK